MAGGPEVPGVVGETGSADRPAAASAPVFCIVAVKSVGLALPEQHPLVTLEEAEAPGAGRRSVSFRVGMTEGVALAHALAGTRAGRPLTHDLFSVVLVRFGVDVLAVRLVGRLGATYLAELDLVGAAAQGREVVPCRPSDGIVLALRRRVPAPVLCDERLFDDGDVMPGATFP